MRYLSLLLLCVLSSTAYAQEKPSLIVDGSLQYADKTFPKNAKWQAMYCSVKNTQPLCELKSVAPKIKKQRVDYLDDEKVVVNHLQAPGQPLFILLGQHFKNRKITTMYATPNRLHITDDSENNQYHTLKNHKKWAIPNTSLFLSAQHVKDGMVQYYINDTNKKQLLFEIPALSTHESDKTPLVHWVGDINGDNKPDIVLEIPDDNCGFDYRMFLSDSNKNIVKQYLQFSGYQEACGC